MEEKRFFILCMMLLIKNSNAGFCESIEFSKKYNQQIFICLKANKQDTECTNVARIAWNIWK